MLICRRKDICSYVILSKKLVILLICRKRKNVATTMGCHVFFQLLNLAITEFRRTGVGLLIPCAAFGSLFLVVPNVLLAEPVVLTRAYRVVVVLRQRVSINASESTSMYFDIGLIYFFIVVS